MSNIEQLNHGIDYSVNKTVDTTKRIVSDPLNLKRALQVVDKTLKVAQIFPEIGEAFKGAYSLMGFHSTFQNMVFWINPFQTKYVDDDKLRKSIDMALAKNIHFPHPAISRDITNKLFSDPCYSKRAFLEKLKTILLVDKKYSAAIVESIMAEVEVEMKPRTLYLIMRMACATILDLEENIKTLDTWKIIDTATIAAAIGQKAPVFLLVISQVARVAFIGIIVLDVYAFTRSIYDIAVAQQQINATTCLDERTKAIAKRTEAIWDLVSSGCAIAHNVLPLFVAVNPPVLLCIGIAWKGTLLAKTLVT